LELAQEARAPRSFSITSSVVVKKKHRTPNKTKDNLFLKGGSNGNEN